MGTLDFRESETPLSEPPGADKRGVMHCVFGPVPTRRLGRSLGIDTVPSKTCNWNCVYCQLGRTHPFVNERREYISAESILAEVKARLAQLPANSIDWITFVSSGEGTLNSSFGEMLRAVKTIASHPVAVITNGSLLHLSEVREELSAADAVLPTLDAFDEASFRRINRSYHDLTFERHLAGIEAFAKMKSRGRLMIEVMLIAGVNDSEDALLKLAALMKRIGPDEINLTLPSRCPVEPWVRIPDDAVLRQAQEILGAKATFAPLPGTKMSTALEEIDLPSIVIRHPLKITDLPSLYQGWPKERIDAMVAQQCEAGKVKLVKRVDTTFIVGRDLRYP